MQNLSFIDLAFFIMDTDENPKHIAGLMLLKKPKNAGKGYVKKTFESFKTFDEPVAPFNLVINMFGLKGPHWEPAKGFDLNQHLFYHYPEQLLNDTQLKEYAADLHVAKMDRRKPLWEVHVIDRVKDARFALYFKIHHAYADGMTLSSWMRRGFAPSPSSNTMIPIWALERPTRKVKKDTYLINKLYEGLKSQVNATRGLVKITTQMYLESLGLTKNAIAIPYRASGSTPFTGQVTPGRQFLTARVAVDRVKQIGKATRSTLNHVALACIDQGLHQYLRDMNITLDQPITIQMPVSLRTKDTVDSGNKLGVVLVDLAKPNADIYERMKEIGYTLQNVRNQVNGVSNEAIEQYTILAGTLGEAAELLRLNDHLPPQANILVSNVPGPKEYLYLNESKIEEIHPISTLATGTHINITLFSYAGILYFGIVATKKLKELDQLAAYIESAFVDLEKAVFVADEL